MKASRRISGTPGPIDWDPRRILARVNRCLWAPKPQQHSGHLRPYPLGTSGPLNRRSSGRRYSEYSEQQEPAAKDAAGMAVAGAAVGSMV